MKEVPLFKNPELQNALSYLSKLTKDELSMVQSVIEGIINPKIRYTDFIDDEEKMRDFKLLTKEEFLNSYSYLTEKEYTLTVQALKGQQT
jgi:hypothetical protein